MCEIGNNCLIGTEFQLGRMKNSGDGQLRELHKNVNVLNVHEHLKMVKLVHFMLCTFYHNKKKKGMLRSTAVVVAD